GGAGEEEHDHQAEKHIGQTGHQVGGRQEQEGQGRGMSGDIEDKPQPLIEHLIELRRRLLWAVGAFFIAFLVCFYFAKQLFNLLVLPFKWAVSWAGLSHRTVELIYTAPQEFFFTQIK